MPGNRDVVIVGGGPGGSAAALGLLRHGIRPLLVERESFPRYHIGESLTGECGVRLRELGLEPQLTDSAYPVKHGVNVWGRDGRNRFWVPVVRIGEDGSRHDTSAWQVRRAEFDQQLLDAALEGGAQLLRASADDVLREDDRVSGIVATTARGRRREIPSRIVLDASGSATFLARCGVTSPKRRGGYEAQVATFSQVTGAVRDSGDDAGNTHIFYGSKNHWAWFIPLDAERTSVGVVAPAGSPGRRGVSEEAFLRSQVLHINPELAQRMRDVQWVEPVRSASNYSYRIDRFTGPGFLCVGDAHRFVDPIFSFGVFVAMQEATFAADAVARHLGGQAEDGPDPFARYAATVERGQDVLQDLIDCFWEFPLAFQRMAHRTHRDDVADCFAGRIYREEPSAAVQTMRRLLKAPRARSAAALSTSRGAAGP